MQHVISTNKILTSLTNKFYVLTYTASELMELHTRFWTSAGITAFCIDVSHRTDVYVWIYSGLADKIAREPNFANFSVKLKETSKLAIMVPLCLSEETAESFNLNLALSFLHQHVPDSCSNFFLWWYTSVNIQECPFAFIVSSEANQ